MRRGTGATAKPPKIRDLFAKKANMISKNIHSAYIVKNKRVFTFLVCARKVTKEHTLLRASDVFKPLEGHDAHSLILFRRF